VARNLKILCNDIWLRNRGFDFDEYKSGGLHEERAVAAWILGISEFL